MHNINIIPTDNKTWTDITREAPDWQFRINTIRGAQTLWRKNNHPAFYGGNQIQRVALDTRLAREWLECAGYDTFALNMAAK
jgi:hypothetical protein